MRGHRMHAHRGVADQGIALGDEALRIDGHQRIRLRPHQWRHRAQAMLEAATDLRPQRRLVHLQQRLRAFRRQGQHCRGLVAVQRQQRHGAAVTEPLPGGLMVRALVAHPTHQHGSAEIAQLRADPAHAPRAGKTAVGRHHQPRRHAAPVGELQLRLARVAAQCLHRDTIEQGQTGLVLHRGERGAADQMIGHQPAEIATAALARREGQCERRGTVHHPRIAQRRDRLRVDPRPQVQLIQQCSRGMGQGDLAAVEGGLRQRRARLRLDQRQRQAAAGQRAGEAQAGRAGPDDGDIHLHAATP
ncbi:hypothetical protein NB706_003685 [Xanthomonas sacchari]|nr:hypothetical protein [Xanthomonas sacchari]